MLTRCLTFALSAVVLAACRSDRAAETPARNLSRLLATPPSDSTTTPADSALAACTFVYSTEEKLRECLVIGHHSTPEAASRAIAVYAAQQRHAWDSAGDAAIARVAAARRARAAQAEAARRAAATWWKQFGGPWVGSTTNRHYYRVHPDCWTGRQLAKADRVYFPSEAAAQAAGYAGVAETGCY